MIALDPEGDVYVLRLGADENRFDDARVAGLEEALDTVEATEGPAALAAGAVHEAVADERLLPRAVERAASLAGKHRPTVRANKLRLFAAVASALRAPVRF